MSAERLAEQLAEMRGMLLEMRDDIRNLRGERATPTRTSYTVEEAATLLGKAAYTIRQWCLEGRINASKRAERRGGSEVWSIAAGELERYRNEGLLPRPTAQRAG